MDTKSLIAEAKARFNHNSAKELLKEKYSSKLIIAEQGGLWKADHQTISILNSFTSKKVVLMDTFNNPVEVDRKALLEKLKEVYEQVMQEWHDEWKTLEGKR
jgi:hypothetical protein